MKACGHFEYQSTCRTCILHHNRKVQRGVWCPPVYSEPPHNGICVMMQSQGIGDVLLGCTAVAGLRRDYPHLPLSYAVRPGLEAWARLCDQWDTVSAPPKGSKVYDPYASYRTELDEQLVRYDNYSRACNTRPGLPHVSIDQDDINWARDKANGAVVLAPFSSHAARSWHLLHWRFLETLLLDRGYRVIIIDGKNGRCGKFVSPALIGERPGRVAALVSAASCTVANDSGIAHLCGLVGARCVALVAQVDGRKVYGFWPSVNVIQASLPCGRCYFRGAWYSPECRSACVNLNTITPYQVIDEVRTYRVSLL